MSALRLDSHLHATHLVHSLGITSSFRLPCLLALLLGTIVLVVVQNKLDLLGLLLLFFDFLVLQVVSATLSAALRRDGEA